MKNVKVKRSFYILEHQTNEGKCLYQPIGAYSEVEIKNRLRKIKDGFKKIYEAFDTLEEYNEAVELLKSQGETLV